LYQFEALSLTECAVCNVSKKCLVLGKEGLGLGLVLKPKMNVSVSGKFGKVSPGSLLEQTFKRLGLVSVSKEKVSFASLQVTANTARLCIPQRFDLFQRPSSEEMYSVLPVLATVVMRRLCMWLIVWGLADVPDWVGIMVSNAINADVGWE